jgi:chromosome partitioning protein
MSYIIAFVSQKGGVGKSTLTRATALELVKNDYSVKVADLDTQQGTVLDWHKRRLDNGFTPNINSVKCYKTIHEAVEQSENFDFLIIDAPARASQATYEISKIANIIIQPSGASIDDLKPAILLFHELVEKNINKNKLFIALCKVSTKTEIEIANEYIKSADYKALDSYILEKPSYRQALNEGKTILENRFIHLKEKADVLIQSILDNFTNLVQP